ncbi:ABC transporter ATP-binding protein [Arhodomonas sp. AD133]|uniref:ABC transporter ATP-binding protein n=1 Tax=Arhodomonas sp. AD133 TaxID=3415009 RepID=UPI003EBBC912
MSLAARNLGWRAGRMPIVQGVELDVPDGELLGLVGPNGSGKSTLLHLLAGLRRPSAGQVTLAGEDLARMPRRRIAQRVALVAQQAETGERLTVREAVELGRTPWLGPFAPFGEDDAAIVDDALRHTGLLALADRRWQTLSGGERQRAHIARALAQRPRLLLLDEPTNHLDIHHQLSILALVRRLRITIVMALHDLNHAMDCDRVGVMDEGRLVALGPPAMTLSPERLHHIFGVNVRYLEDPQDGRTVLRFEAP